MTIPLPVHRITELATRKYSTRHRAGGRYTLITVRLRMRYRSAVLLIAAALGIFGALRAQRPFQQYNAAEYEDFPLPPDWNVKTEWTRARLRYPSVYGPNFRGEDLNWT